MGVPCAAPGHPVPHFPQFAGSVLVSVVAAWAAARIGSRVNAARAMRKEEEG